MADEVLFREVQPFRQWWFLLLVAGTALIGWSAWVQQIVIGEPFGVDPASDAVVWALWIVFGVLVPLAALSVRLVTVVTASGLTVRFPPFRPRRISPEEILDIRPVEVRPVANWAGYGYRRRSDGDVAFLVRGRDAVRVTLGESRAVVIGTRKTEQLATALVEARRAGA